MRRTSRWIAGACGLIALVAAAPAGAATTIGQAAPLGAAQSCSGATLFVQGSVGAEPTYDVPAGGGILTSWSVRGIGVPSTVKLMVVTPEPGPAYRINAVSGLETVPASDVATFSLNLPVGGGERIALWVPAPGSHTCFWSSGIAGDSMQFRALSHPEPAPGEVFPVNATDMLSRVNVEATLESDCDGDGLADESQDTDVRGCPPPPLTSITKGPPDRVKTKRKRAKVTFEFTADEAGATFECSLDGAPFAGCSSPYTVKVRKGPHQIAIRATDVGGNLEGTPASDSFKVKRKKKKRKKK
jgi:hypothetical protein